MKNTVKIIHADLQHWGKECLVVGDRVGCEPKGEQEVFSVLEVQTQQREVSMWSGLSLGQG